MTLRTFTIADIRSWEPCYDPGKHLPEDWKGTALDLLRLQRIPAGDRLWVVLRDGIIADKTLRLFAVWCAREALKLVDNPDPRSVAACDVAERYAMGEATAAELKAAAWAAADAAWDAARAARAAWAAADAARAARDAAGAAADAAADAADAAWDAARAWDAREAARQAQVAHLITMLEGEGK